MKAVFELHLELRPLLLGDLLFLGDFAESGLAAAEVVHDPLDLSGEPSTPTGASSCCVALRPALARRTTALGDHNVLVGREGALVFGPSALVLVLAFATGLLGFGRMPLSSPASIRL